MAVHPELRRAGVTEREAEVLRALATRLTNAEIAEGLYISVRTVESHVSALLRKLQAADRRALAAVAQRTLRAGAVQVPLPARLADAGSTSPFVGRSGELEQLDRLVDTVRSAGRRHLVLVTGEAGVGKTRLAAEEARRAGVGGAIVLYGFCEEDALIPFQPFTEAVRPLVGEGTEPLADLVSRLQTASDRYALFEEFDRLLATSPDPVVLVLDDAQWVDPSGVQLMRHLFRHIDRSPLLLIAAARPEGADPRHRLATALDVAEAARAFGTIVLGGLSPSEVENLLERSDGGSDLDARMLWERSGGNPFLLTELLKDPPDAHEVSTGVRDAIVRRITGLGSGVFDVLATAAVLGETFRPDVVLAALGGEPTRHEAALQRAIGAGFVVEGARPGLVRFAHSILRDAVLGVTTHSRQGEIRLRIAEALEARGGFEAVVDAARHRHAALPRGDPLAACSAALAAAGEASLRLAYEVGVSCASMALDAIEAGGGGEAERAEALLVRGDAHLKAGDLGAAVDDFREALRIARRLRLQPTWTRAALGWAAASPLWARQPDLRIALEELLTAGVDDLGLRAAIRARFSQVLYYEGPEDRRAALTAAAVAEARESGRADVLATVLLCEHGSLWRPDDPDRTTVARDIVAAASATGDRELEAEALGWLGVDLLEEGETEAAGEAFSKHASLAEALRHKLLLRDRELWAAMRAIVAGEHDRADEHVARARDFGEAAHDPSAEPIYWVQRYWLACELADSSAMEEVVEPCERQMRTSGGAPAWRAALAMLHARRGDRSAAREHYEPLAAEGFQAIPRDAVWLNAITYLAETCASLWDRRRASILYGILEPYAGRFALIDRGLGFKGSVQRFLGLLAVCDGDLNTAEQHLKQALADHRRIGAVPLATRTEADIASMRAVNK